MRNLIIDPEFRDKIPGLSLDEFQKLEQNILDDGEVREPLVVWGETIVDGHHRWKIIQNHPEIPYQIKQMEFADKWAAIVWMCRNQLGRRNITDEQKTVLIAEASKAQKLTHGGERGTGRDELGQFTASDQNGHLRGERTRSIIAKQFGVGQGTVQRAEQFLDGLDAADEVSPGIKEAVLSGEVKAPKQMIAEIRKLPNEQKKDVVDAIKQGDTDTARSILRPIQTSEPEKEREPMTIEEFDDLLKSVIRDMDDGLNLHMVLTHREMLDNQNGRKATIKTLKSGIEVINKYINMVNNIEEE